jgi:hypothetical protein
MMIRPIAISSVSIMLGRMTRTFCTFCDIAFLH